MREKENKKSERLYVRASPDLKEKLKSYCIEQGKTLTQVITRAIENYII